MRRPPRSQAEWRAWNDFGLHENGRNRNMDLGDIATGLAAVSEEFDTAHTETVNEHDHLETASAGLEAAHQRADQALGTLAALSGGSYPHELEDARAQAGQGTDLLEEAAKLAIDAKEKAEEAYKLLLEASNNTSRYVERLIAGS